jgi:hypothetical protein
MLEHSTVVYLNKGDYLDVRVSKTQSTAATVPAAGNDAWTTLAKIGGSVYGGEPNPGAGAVHYLSVSVPSSATTHTQLASGGGLQQTWGGVSIGGQGIVVPVTGLYDVSFSGTFSTSANGTIRAMLVQRNGGNVTGAYGSAPGQYAAPSASTTGFGALLSASGVMLLSAGDVIGLYARQDSGAALSVTGTLAVRFVKSP